MERKTVAKKWHQNCIPFEFKYKQEENPNLFIEQAITSDSFCVSHLEHLYHVLTVSRIVQPGLAHPKLSQKISLNYHRHHPPQQKRFERF